MLTQVDNIESNDDIVIDTGILEAKLNNLKNVDLKGASVDVYVTKVSTSNKLKRFGSIKSLKIETNSKNEFLNYVKNCIDFNNHLVEYKTINTNQDNRFFYIEKSSSDFSQFLEYISKYDIDTVKGMDELHEYNSYVIQLTLKNPSRKIFAFRYISKAWDIKKHPNKILFVEVMSGELIAKVSDVPKFQITSKIDFIQFEDDVFISDLSNFETAMNFHESLKEQKEIASEELCENKTISSTSVDTFKKVIGNDKHLMRQLASVRNKGYYKNDIWLSKLRHVAKDASNWKIKFDDNGYIEILEDKEYIKEVLTLLQNKRVRTVVDGIIFDVDGELIEVK